MRKKWMSSTLALVLAGTTVASMMPAVPVSAKGAEAASGTTYYVDSKKGKDSNAGTSESEAFQTLDKVNELDLNPVRSIAYASLYALSFSVSVALFLSFVSSSPSISRYSASSIKILEDTVPFHL